jgi:hypothetical protein
MKDATAATPYIEKIKEIDPTNKRMEAFGKVVEDFKEEKTRIFYSITFQLRSLSICNLTGFFV